MSFTVNIGNAALQALVKLSSVKVILVSYMEKLSLKVVYFVMKEKYFWEIVRGNKTFEMRAASKHWRSNIPGRTHAVFQNGHLPAMQECFLV